MRDEPTGEPAGDTSWDERRLCPDGGCVGVVGPSGACTTCGKVDPEAVRDAARAAAKAEAAAEDGDEGREGGEGEDAGDDRDGDPSSVAAAGKDEGDEGDEWQRRRLCDDGACIGVVLDGRCTTCGTKQ